MKKFISILLFFAVFAFFGCEDVLNDFKNAGDNLKDNLTDTAEETYLGDTEIPNNKSNKVGTNELKGKTISDGTTKLTFYNSYVTKSDDKSGLANARSEDHVAGKMDFTYSYNSNDKTLDFQLNQIWGSGLSTAQTYEKQIEKATETYKSVADKVLTELDKDIYYTVFNTHPDLAQYKDGIKEIVKDEAIEYVKTQEDLLADYLEAKYNAVIKFGYEFDSEENPTQLTLKEKFQGDLTDASSKFVWSQNGCTITLNDYDNVIPFKVELERENENGEVVTDIYVGVPKITKTNDTTGSIEVSLLPYSGDVLENGTFIATSISTKVSSFVVDAITDLRFSTLAKIFSELESSGNDSRSDTLELFLYYVLGTPNASGNSFGFEATYEISEDNLILTITNIPDYMDGYFDENYTIELTHTPLLGATYDIVK